MNFQHLRRAALPLIGCLSLAAAMPLSAQKANPQLIVRADDMGSFRAANIACLAGYQKGIETDIEVMVVTAWFPEAVRLLKENPGIDVGLHLTFTSEWENVKWRPLTHCPSLCDENGYFLPMMMPHKAYPGMAITERKWNLAEVEQEARAQIEMALRNIPQISHISGHMGSTGFDPSVVELMNRLAEEYHLPIINRVSAMEHYHFDYVGYNGPSKTAAEKETSFLKMLDTLQPGKRYMFVDHPGLDNEEMQAVWHIGYEDVAKDRQGVTNLFTSAKVKQAIEQKGIELISYNELTKSLPRAAATKKLDKAFDAYLKAVEKSGQDLHSVMVLQGGKVLKEQWLSEGNAKTPHVLNSVSKTFTATAVGFAVGEGKLKLTDKVIRFFPEETPANPDEHLQALTVQDLLTMSSGHDVDPTALVRTPENKDKNWAAIFLNAPLKHKPGTYFCYNSLGTYMLSAIVQKVTGEKVIDYLYPRLFRPLGIVGAHWDESPQGICTGGWGLYVKTEDLAKMGQFLLQKGQWNGQQLLPASWVEEATTKHIECRPAGMTPEAVAKTMKVKDSDWLQGYGYQMWRCRHNGVRADGANGQYIILLPEKDAVIVTTANIGDMQAEINLIWKYLLPAL